MQLSRGWPSVIYHVVLSYLGSNRIVKILNTKWFYDKIIKRLLNELGRTRWENIWPLVRKDGPLCAQS